jgi:hypothetical protein
LLVVIDSDKNINALFSLITYTLNISAENGSVVTAPNQTVFNHGTEVTLIAIPDAGYMFNSWAGDTLGAIINNDTLIVNMDAHKHLVVNFILIDGIIQGKESFNCIVSPNPSNGIFRIDLEPHTNYTYSVYSINGTPIKNGTTKGQFEIDLNSFAKGIYMLKIKTDLILDVKKLILN